MKRVLFRLIVTFVMISAVVQNTLAQLLTEEDVRAAANEANRSLPMQVDEDSELINILPVGMTLIYNLRYLSVTSGEFTEEDIHASSMVDRPRGIKAACTNPRLKDMMRLGVILKYIYYGSDGGFINEWSVSISTCESQ